MDELELAVDGREEQAVTKEAVDETETREIWLEEGLGDDGECGESSRS